MKVLICGSRHWSNYNSTLSVMRRLMNRYGPDIIIIEGGAPGADSLARKAAIECSLTYKEFPADWDKHGRKAGPIRNQRMLDENPDIVIAFHENIESSKGTKDMVSKAKRKGVPVYIIRE